MAKKHEVKEDEVTDVLAAEEFAVPAPDPALTPEQLDLPSDLVGEEPRDVLAAEEFAMPAPDEARVTLQENWHRRPQLATLIATIAIKIVALTVGLWVWRRARAKRRDG